jgi:putative iron-regulated protein
MKFNSLKVAVLAGGFVLFSTVGAFSASIDKKAVVDTYANIAEAIYQDSLQSAKALKSAVLNLTQGPSAASLSAARAAWIAAREPYQQSEAFRFGNPLVDDWEGKVNAWPLDEGLIDYVDSSYGNESDENALYAVNVIANSKLNINGKSIDAAHITPDFLTATLHEAEEVEANVATGYHAIEFLLWGQDLNGTNAGAGNRAFTDFDVTNCSGGNCDRRNAYLLAATDLLISDLAEMADLWKADGDARRYVTSNPDKGISAMLSGMGSLSYGELAGERMKLGLLLKDPEEEHDCFSDNTHNSHYFDQIGIRNVYLGHYRKTDGTIVSGTSLSDLVAHADAGLDGEVKDKLNATVTAMAIMRARAESIEAYDQMIGEDNPEGNAVVQAAIDGLVAQTRSIERVISTLELGGIELEGSDSLDNPNAVFQ